MKLTSKRAETKYNRHLLGDTSFLDHLPQRQAKILLDHLFDQTTTRRGEQRGIYQIRQHSLPIEQGRRANVIEFPSSWNSWRGWFEECKEYRNQAEQLFRQLVLCTCLRHRVLFEGDVIVLIKPAKANQPLGYRPRHFTMIIGTSLVETSLGDLVLGNKFSWPTWPLEYWDRLAEFSSQKRVTMNFRACHFTTNPTLFQLYIHLGKRGQDQILTFTNVSSADLVGQMLTSPDAEPVTVWFQESASLGQEGHWHKSVKTTFYFGPYLTVWGMLLDILAFPRSGHQFPHDVGPVHESDLVALPLNSWLTLDPELIFWELKDAYQLANSVGKRTKTF